MSIQSTTIKTGVYCIRNTVNGKVYVGSAGRSLEGRWADHLKRLSGNYHYNFHLQTSWNKHGAEVFVFEVLEKCPPEQCVEREQYWIDTLKAANKRHGYNITPTAGSQLGFRHSEETKRRNGETKKGMKHTEEVKKQSGEAARASWEDPQQRAQRVASLRKAAKRKDVQARKSAKMKGRKLSAEHCAKIAAARKGYRMSEEQKAKLSEASKQQWERDRERLTEINRRNGQRPEVRAKNSASNKGRVAWNKGVPMSLEQRAKMKGHRHSAESRAKMSASKKALAEERRRQCQAAEDERLSPPLLGSEQSELGGDAEK